MPEIPQFVIDRAQSQHPVFTADEVARWPVGLFDQLIDCAVLSPAANAKSIVCNTCNEDHCEEVQFVESPVGSGLRAYILCPDCGRVQVLLERLRRWAVNLEKAIAIAREAGNRSDVRTIHLHYNSGHCAYVCIVDAKKRAFDFSTNTFRHIDEFQRPEEACLFASGRMESRAHFGFSYTVSLDLYKLVANVPDASIPADGLVFSIQWLVQKDDAVSPRDDLVLPDSARIRYLNGQFAIIDASSQEMFDENMSFAQRQQWIDKRAHFRDEEFAKHGELSEKLDNAIAAADVPSALRILAGSIWFWAKGLERHLFDHFYFDAKDSSFCRMFQISPDAPFHILPSWLMQPWIGMHQVFDLLEFHKSSEIAKAYSARMDMLVQTRDEFSQLVVEATRKFEWRIDIESFVFLQEQEKGLRHRASAICEYLNLLATQVEAMRPVNPAVEDDPISERAQSVLVAMMEMNAVDSDRRKPTEDIVARALGSTASPNAVKTVMSELNTRQFVRSKIGRGGGVWLTEKGLERASKLRAH